MSPGDKKLIRARGGERQIAALEGMLAVSLFCDACNFLMIMSSFNVLTMVCYCLQDIRDKIEALEAKELSLDDMGDDDSDYILIDRFKKRFVKVWAKLCAVKGRDMSTGRLVECKFLFEGESEE
jgi:hypothetical protein